jgi:phosphatidylglycerol:prolipoprotein diacylglycerol transferase
MFTPFYEGIYFAIAILFGLIFGMRALERRGLHDKDYDLVVVWGLIGAIVGGRLFHVLFWGNDYYLHNPEKIFAMWEGGISITGGIAGALVAALLTCRWRKQSFSAILAPIAPVILASQALGRIGCFLNGDAFGLPTSLPWGVQLRRYGYDLFEGHIDPRFSSSAWAWCHDQGLVSATSTVTVKLHPTQIYEAIFDLCLAAGLVFAARKKASNKLICFMYVAGYSLFRFLVEYIRGDREEIFLLNTSLIQFVLLIVAAVFICLAAAEGRSSRARLSR